MTAPASYDIDGMAWQLRRVYHYTTSGCTPATCPGRDCMDRAGLSEHGFRAVAELAWRIAEANLPAGVLTQRELEKCTIGSPAQFEGITLICWDEHNPEGTQSVLIADHDPVRLEEVIGAVAEHRAAHV